MQYDRSQWKVMNLILVPGHFVTESVIEKCKPLKSSARRAGWVGCNILLYMIPDDGKLPVIQTNEVSDEEHVRKKWQRYEWLKDQRARARGWTSDVLWCVRQIGRRRFSLSEVYEFEGKLATLHPDNRRVRPKIRQQLQILRDKGIIRFIDNRGNYEVIETGF